jgi:hypothetical protein
MRLLFLGQLFQQDDCLVDPATLEPRTVKGFFYPSSKVSQDSLL